MKQYDSSAKVILRFIYTFPTVALVTSPYCEVPCAVEVISVDKELFQDLALHRPRKLDQEENLKFMPISRLSHLHCAQPLGCCICFIHPVGRRIRKC